MGAPDILVGIGASRIVTPKKCKLLCDRLAKTEDIIVLALVYYRASTAKALSYAVRTTAGRECIEDRLMLEELGSGCYESTLINGNGKFRVIPILIAKAVDFWLAFVERVDICMLKIFDEAGLALEELCVIVASQGLTVLVDLA